MEKVDELDRVACPERPNDKVVPERVYSGVGQDKKPVRRGILPKHAHDFSGDECPWTGHPVHVTREEKKD